MDILSFAREWAGPILIGGSAAMMIYVLAWIWNSRDSGHKSRFSNKNEE